jgi:hypothetical protein
VEEVRLNIEVSEIELPTGILMPMKLSLVNILRVYLSI